MMLGYKHMVRCRCVLPQFKKMADPPQHQFAVFSVVDDDDKVKLKYAQCPNCGIIHRITEIGKSEVVQGREAMSTILSVNDVRTSLPEALVSILDGNQADLPTWEAAQFIYESKRWGDFVVLRTETEGGLKQGKYVRILGEKMFKVETFARED